MTSENKRRITNSVEFPKVIAFSRSPLCETVSKTIFVKCNLPTPGKIPFSLEIVSPHPYFKIEPLRGEISGKEVSPITVTFTPITLGTCSMTIKFFLDEPGYIPIESIISACATSGIIESKELEVAETNIAQYINNKSKKLNEFMGDESSFKGTGTIKFKNTEPLGNDKKASINRNNDPTATMLASTFHSSDLSKALDAVIQDNVLLSSKVLNKNSTTGLVALDGILKSTVPVRPRGIGSGIVYDASAQWNTTNHKKALLQKLQKLQNSGMDATIQGRNEVIIPRIKDDKLVEGLRVPPSLESTYQVNFVITQEPGKLKPKDLKIAIERNRAEKELRAEEQKKMREEGGGAGLLDVRGILAEERLNLAEADPFKRQLREMAFTADVDDVAKAEIEKSFRVSEECIGSTLLSDDDINLVLQQRERALLYKKRTEWRNIQAKQHTTLYPPTSSKVKAGTAATTANILSTSLSPSFDSNRNDIWAKRMNTLRRFISLVSRWLIRTRIAKNLVSIKKAMEIAGVKTKEEVKVWVASDNSSKNQGCSKNVVSKKGKDVVSSDENTKPSTVITMVCSQNNELIDKRFIVDDTLNYKRLQIDRSILKRNLFPKYEFEEGSSRKEIDPDNFKSIDLFDDSSYFPLKVRPEYEILSYEMLRTPKLAIYFSPGAHKNLRLGAPEELNIRPAADKLLNLYDLKSIAPTEPQLITMSKESVKLLSSVPQFDIFAELKLPDAPNNKVLQDISEIDELLSTPSWLTNDPCWSIQELTFFSAKPDIRTYVPEPRLTEMDDDWIFRPMSEKLEYTEDNTLRTKLLKQAGFLSANMYLFGGQESRSVEAPPPCGPTLVDFYMPDNDRHKSGLVCFKTDHERGLLTSDKEVPGLRNKKDSADHLTDSESDDDEIYINQKPSMAVARKILRPNEETKLDNERMLPLSPTKGNYNNRDSDHSPFSPTFSQSEFNLAERDRKDDQVELMRDRKTLDLEATVQRNRYEYADMLTKKLIMLSSSTICPIQALAVPVPFHQYEDDVYKLDYIQKAFAPQTNFANT